MTREVGHERLANMLVMLTLALFVLATTRCAWMTDDAFVTLRTIDNLLAGFGPVWNPGERVQAYTHPLWALVLLVVYGVTGEPMITTMLLGVVVSTVVVWLVSARLSPGRGPAVLGLVLFVSSKAFVDFSTSGLENPLSHSLIAVFALVVFDERVTGERRVFRLGLCASLAMLTRLDHGLFLLPTLGAELVWSPSRRQLWRPLLQGLLPLAVWELFSVGYYGFVFPNTAYAKLATGIQNAELLRQGFGYLGTTLDLDPLTAGVIGLGVLLGLRTPDRRVRALVVGVLLHLVFVVRVGGDYMSGRFLTSSFLIAVIVLLRMRFGQTRDWLVVAAVSLLLGLVSPLAPLRSDASYTGRTAERTLLKTGVTDERAFIYANTGLLSRKRDAMPEHFFVSEGFRIRDSPERVHVNCCIGMVGYYAGPNHHIIDELALADPLLARLPIIPDPDWRIGHFKRAIPAGYEETVRTGVNHLTDPQLAHFYDDLWLITRGPLLSVARLGAIWRLNVSSPVFEGAEHETL